MEWIRMLLLAAVLLGYPLLPGSLLNYIRQRKNNKLIQQNMYVTGVLVYGALFSMLAFVGVYKQVPFERFARIAFVCNVCLAAVVIISLLLIKDYRCFCRKGLKNLKAQIDRTWCLFAAAYLLIALVYVIRPFPLETGFDTPERVVTILQTGLLSGTNHLTGEITGQIISLKECTRNLPLFYACLCRWFAVSPAKLLFSVIPFTNLLLIFLAAASLAKCFFAGMKRMRAEYLILFSLLTLCGNEAYMNTSYGILHFPYEGQTLFSSMILPLAFAACWEKVDVCLLLLLMINALFLAGPENGLLILLIEMGLLLFVTLVLRIWKRRGSKWM